MLESAASKFPLVFVRAVYLRVQHQFVTQITDC
jgi:hypothetical protein